MKARIYSIALLAALVFSAAYAGPQAPGLTNKNNGIGNTNSSVQPMGKVNISHDGTMIGDGTPAAPLGVAVPLDLNGASESSILTVTNSGLFGSAIVATGGNSLTGDSGVGVKAFGGSSTGGFGGWGLVAYGGDSASSKGGLGVYGRGGIGRGVGQSGGTGIYGIAGEGQNGAVDGFAGAFVGEVIVYGNFTVGGGGTKNFKIDHPLDPENKYLYHAAIESSEVLNIYSGNVTTDENGDVAVTLPDWFEAVNRDFRYQLTVVGTFAQAIVSDEVKNHLFKIKTNAPGVKVSWQVTGVRSDAAMRKHPFKVEAEKLQSERGFYLAPEAYDQPAERGIRWARNPQMKEELELKQKPQQRDR
jgi:hypothetical protein